MSFRNWTQEMVNAHNAEVKAGREKSPGKSGIQIKHEQMTAEMLKGISIAEAALIINAREFWPVITAAAISQQPEDRMNKTEAKFAEMILEPLRLAGQIKKWEYEPFNFRVAPDRFYKPDFAAWHFDGTITVIEIKAYELHRDTITKLKVIQERYGTPFFRFKLFQWTGGEWIQRA